jgi:hypothetical protein
MGNPNAVSRRKEFKLRELPIIPNIIKAYRTAGYKVVDGIETIIIEEPNSTFRIFISRVSHSLQLYYLGEWQFTKEYHVPNIQTVEDVIALESSFKELFG